MESRARSTPGFHPTGPEDTSISAIGKEEKPITSTSYAGVRLTRWTKSAAGTLLHFADARILEASDVGVVLELLEHEPAIDPRRGRQRMQLVLPVALIEAIAEATGVTWTAGCECGMRLDGDPGPCPVCEANVTTPDGAR